MKNQKQSKNPITLYLRSLGIGSMALATVVGMVELNNHPANRYVLPSQVVQVNNQNELNNPIRRESEENSPIYVSYSESQRTPSRSGRY